MSAAELLSNAEANRYDVSMAELSSDGKDVVVISDLHLAAGLKASLNYSGTENFFADDSLGRFLTHMNVAAGQKKSILVINGDFIDFLRITEIPGSDSDFTAWRDLLTIVGIKKDINSLKSSITDKERTFGLKTDDYKSVWKLWICSHGHSSVFDALSSWIMDGNHLLVVKGNHDLEWYWKPVRDALRFLISQRLAKTINKTEVETLSSMVLKRLMFADDTVLIDERIYLEHGHRYENFTRVYGPPVLKNESELNLPFGSFFNRYLINKIELAYPFLDNVRPQPKLLPLLLRERFPLALKVLFSYVPFTLLVIPKGQYKYALRYLFDFLLIIVLPLALTAFIIYKNVDISVFNGNDIGQMGKQILSVAKNFVFLSLSYFLGRLMSKLQLSPPGSLQPMAKKIADKHPSIDIVTFGHTHDPARCTWEGGKHYYNTGTWMPVFEMDAADIREDKTYTFLYFKSAVGSGNLMRWNDDALRIDPLNLVDRGTNCE